jgi:hypothetical protein
MLMPGCDLSANSMALMNYGDADAKAAPKKQKAGDSPAFSKNGGADGSRTHGL